MTTTHPTIVTTGVAGPTGAAYRVAVASVVLEALQVALAVLEAAVLEAAERTEGSRKLKVENCLARPDCFHTG